jgi:hypothetical protein
MRRARILVLSALACMLVAGPVSAAKPMIERIPINDIGILDEFLTDECGYDIWVDATGHVTFHWWTDAEDNTLREVNNYNVHLTFYSESGSISTRDIGADRVTYHDDGTFTVTIMGNVTSLQVPGQGRVYSDVGRLVLHFSFPDPEGPPVIDVLSAAGQHGEEGPVAALCEILAP